MLPRWFCMGWRKVPLFPTSVWGANPNSCRLFDQIRKLLRLMGKHKVCWRKEQLPTLHIRRPWKITSKNLEITHKNLGFLGVLKSSRGPQEVLVSCSKGGLFLQEKKSYSTEIKASRVVVIVNPRVILPRPLLALHRMVGW